MSQTPTKSTTLTLSLSGEVIQDMAPKSRTPSAITKKIQAVNSSLKNKRSMSQEDFQAMLESAAERKKTIDETKSLKAKELVEKAKFIASRTKKTNENAMSARFEKIQEKLDWAAMKKDQREMERRERLGVRERKNGTPTKRNDILNEKLQAAENRRKALEQSMLTKLSQHNRTVVTIREACSPKPASKIFSKIEAAEKRRKLFEKEQCEKLHRHGLHVEEVRKKRKSMVGEGKECV